jgi:aminopeptidase N
MAKNVKRLYEQFHPENYNLTLFLDPVNLQFSGTVVITGKKVGRPSQRITLHQKDLRITSAKAVHKSKNTKEEINIDRINAHSSYDEIRLHSEKLLYPGEYEITLDFTGKITKQMTGLYPCHFTHEGKDKLLLATQFESHHAREVFPCIDEPEAKATFDLTLKGPKSHTFLSNTPEASSKDVGESKQVTFLTTPIMSSYLLAFVVGELHCVEAKNKSGIEMRTWASVAQPKKFLKYANDEAVRIIDFFEDYFKTPFPLKKCDQVALPDFESGAMENWGLITYREVALLADPDNRSISSEQYVSMVVAHELSHQWFGNLVTMRWWDDLWLNESFASLMEHVALAKLHPDWNQWEHYAASDIIACSNRDIYTDVQPVRVEVRHPDEIQTLFDPAIVYAKGGRLLKMLMDYIGEDAFRAGLKKYFADHKYANTTRDDLWRALSEASKVDVNKFMNPWLSQSGMPLVRVNSEENTIKLSQERFILDANNDSSLWPIPLLADQDVKPAIFDTKTAEVKSTDSTTVFNKNGSGHYLVSYENDEQMENLISSIRNQKIPAEARINILNDLLLMARRGDKSIVDGLKVIADCDKEPRDAVWGMIARTVAQAMMLTEGNKILENKVKHLKFNLGQHWHKKLGWVSTQEEDSNTSLLRTTAIAFMIGGEDKLAIKHALNLYNSQDPENLPAEQRPIILGVAVRHDGSTQIIKDLIEQYKTSHNPDLQLAIASALTHTKDIKVAEKLIAEGISKGGFVRAQDIFRWFAMLMRNQHTRQLAWDWMVKNWNFIEEEFGRSKSLDHFVVYSAGPLHTKEWQKKFVDFWSPKQSQVVLQRNIKVAFSEIEARVAWHNRDLPALKKYFS